MKWLSWIFIPINLFIARKLAIQRLARHNHDVFPSTCMIVFFHYLRTLTFFLTFFFIFFVCWSTLIGKPFWARCFPTWVRVVAIHRIRKGMRCLFRLFHKKYNEFANYDPVQRAVWVFRFLLPLPIRAGIRMMFLLRNCVHSNQTALVENHLKTIGKDQRCSSQLIGGSYCKPGCCYNVLVDGLAKQATFRC